MSKYLSLPGSENLHVTARGESFKIEALSKTKAVTEVTDAFTQQRAINAVAIAKGLMKEVQQSREEVKRPIIDIGKEIDKVAVEFCMPLTFEVTRIELLIAEFQRSEADRIEGEKQSRLAQQLKEQQETLRLQREQQEATDRLAKATTKAARELAEKTAHEIAVQQAELEINQQEQASNEITTAPKVEGGSVRKTFDFEVVDIAALYAKHPDCVKMEPKKREIAVLIEACQRSHPSGPINIPGLKVTENLKVSVRSVPTAIALE